MAGDAEPALHEVVVAASSLLDPAALADLTVRHIRRLVQADGAWLTWWDADYSVLVPLAVDDERIGRPEPVCHRGQGLAGAAFDTGETVRVDDYAGEVDHPLPWSQMVSGVGVPLVAGERPAGALTVQSYTPRTFTDREVGLLERAAEQVGPALQTMGLLALAGRRTAEAEAFGALMRTGSRVVEDAAVATLICEYAVRLLGADVAGVALRDPLGTASAWRGVVGATTEEWREHRYGAHHPAAATLFGGEVRVVDGPDGGRFDSEIFPFFAAESVRRGIAVPLVDEGRSLGALSVGWRFRPELPKAQVAFAEALAGFAATLVTRAQATSQRDALVANAPVVLAAMDTDGAITICEGAAAQAVGLGPELVGRSAADVLAEAPELAEGLGAVLHGGDARRLQVEFRGRTFDAHLLSPEAGSYLVATDITEAEAARAELQHQAVTDALTSLPNRAEAMRRTGEALAAGPLVTICGDIRAFDGVNATLGYDAADELLRELGARLAVDLADAVVVGRVGGDEFVVVLEGDDPVAAVERVRASLEAPVAGTQVDARFGIALGVPGDDAATFLRRADVALQLARRSTDVAIVYEADIAADRALDHQLARDLHTALAAGALEVAYQPIVALPDRRTCHCEALARWTHPEHGPIGPDRFVGLAERSGRIGLLTRLVLDRALAEIPAALGLPVSVNVSPLDLADPGFADVVADRLAAHGVAADRLILELTESEELARGRDTLVALAAMGVTVAIDDFGRGWSSLELLKRLPARQLKLDRAFVSELADDVTNQAIVRAAVSIAAAFGMQVIAEGVEDDATLAAVEQLGCDTVQGFLLARPMSAAALRDWLG